MSDCYTALEISIFIRDDHGMKFLGVVFVFLLIAFVLGWGILEVMHGRYWLLIGGVLAYVLAFSKLGCLPPKSHH